MGRPINKRYFSANAKNNIKVQFHNGTASVAGYIVKQRGSKTFVCTANGSLLKSCRLVDKASGSLAAGEMSITLKLDDGTVVRAIKISARRFTANNGRSYPWNFSASTTDGAGRIEEAGTSTVAVTTATGATNYEGDAQ
jgi:hypothetical protein